MEIERIDGPSNELGDLVGLVSISALAGFLGPERSSWLKEIGSTVNQENLAQLIAVEHGLKCFSDSNIRSELLIACGYSEYLEKYKFFNYNNRRQLLDLIDLLSLSPDLIETRDASIPPIVSVSADKTLYPYQNWVRKNINSFLDDPGDRRAIVHMPTGAGKTRTSLEAVCDFVRGLKDSAVSIVWLAHSEELCEQAYETLRSLWSIHGSETADIVRCWGGKSIPAIEIDRLTFVVTSFQTAYGMAISGDNSRFRNFSKFKSKNALVVVDEAHQSTAPTYQQAIESVSNSRSKILGLTATPGRHGVGASTEATEELANFYCNNKIDITDESGRELDDPIGFLQGKGVLSEIERFKLKGMDIELTESEKANMSRHLDIPPSVLKRIGQNLTRTNYIAAHVMELAIGRGFQTIVFASSKQNAIDMAIILRLKGCPAAAVTGESTDRAESISKFKFGELKVLTNFGVLTAGFDSPNIRAVVVARPTTSVVLYSQMIGRGLRGEAMGGTKECLLVDVVDNIENMPPAQEAFTFFDNYYG
jgi:DNA repair protein RadD